MRRVSVLVALCVFVSAFAYAETWTGKLYDANCISQHEGKDMSACAPTESATMFVLQVSEKTYKLDAEGNKMAVEALKKSRSGAERAEEATEQESEEAEKPNEPSGMEAGEHRAEEVTATVRGALAGDEIKVESIEVK